LEVVENWEWRENDRCSLKKTLWFGIEAALCDWITYGSEVNTERETVLLIMELSMRMRMRKSVSELNCGGVEEQSSLELLLGTVWQSIGLVYKLLWKRRDNVLKTEPEVEPLWPLV
jgi:hypothetical protein